MIEINGALVGEYPGLPEMRAKRVKQAQTFLKIRRRLGIAAQSLVDGTAITQRPGIAVFIGQAAKCRQGQFEMPKRVVIIAMTATNLTKHRLHPGNSSR